MLQFNHPKLENSTSTRGTRTAVRCSELIRACPNPYLLRSSANLPNLNRSTTSNLKPQPPTLQRDHANFRGSIFRVRLIFVLRCGRFYSLFKETRPCLHTYNPPMMPLSRLNRVVFPYTLDIHPPFMVNFIYKFSGGQHDH